MCCIIIEWGKIPALQDCSYAHVTMHTCTHTHVYVHIETGTLEKYLKTNNILFWKKENK